MLSDRGKSIFFPHQGILGQTVEARGKDINATIGMACEDDGSIMSLPSISEKIALDKDLVFPYASSFGNQKLRQEWQKLILKKNPSIKTDISLPVVTNALTHGLLVAGYLFADQDTEIILATPFWGNYNLIFNITYGAKLSSFPVFKGESFNIDGFRKSLNSGPGKKIVLFNFPNNPTGYTPTEAEMKQLVEVIDDYTTKNKLVVLCDDAYFGLVYEKGVFEESAFSKFCNLNNNILTVKLDGITKEYFSWGLRVGFITFGCRLGDRELYSALEDKAAGAVRATISNASNLSQTLFLQALSDQNYRNEKAAKQDVLQARYLTVKKILSDDKYKKYFKPLPFNSGYFMCVELIDRLAAEKVRQHLLGKYNTGVISTGQLIRIAFSSVAANTLEYLFNNIYKACQDLDR